MNLETQIRPDLWSAIRSSYDLRRFTSAILDGIYYLSVSEELKSTNNNATIIFATRFLPADFWPRYDEVARLRIENKLLSDIRNGRYDPSQRKCLAGVLGTWATKTAPYFALKDSFVAILLDKLESRDRTEQAYVFQYYFYLFPKLMNQPSARYIRVKAGLKAGSKLFFDHLNVQIEFGSPDDPEHKWTQPFVEDIENFDEEIIVSPVTEDDIPF